MDKNYLVTEDGVVVRPGDTVYNYYDMRPVVIGEIKSYDLENIDENTNHKRDIWVSMIPTTEGVRGSDLLNGERICSMEFAQMRKFRDADTIDAKTAIKNHG